MEEKLELSGAQWANRFRGSTGTRELSGNFRQAVEDFIYAMKQAGMKVVINSTYRAPKRSYLMHYSWRIAKNGLDPEKIPSMQGVDINWNHGTKEKSVKAAKDMTLAFDTHTLQTKPALRSQHNSGLAIDINVSWGKTVEIKDADGNLVKINTLPRTGMNKQLIAVGKTYGVQKYRGPGRDFPHWSNNGL
ncbi:peptidoglycan-binding domain-containing protein [Rugamonas rubra]|uniref:peptidoglycan-binding domain-containing protein n=1 Tax=Rugamonas rubra TaxID=758825 RepID=UPI00111333A8|nr:peptidoglycan-binding domain-containing protein [Rugamonas rubra]